MIIQLQKQIKNITFEGTIPFFLNVCFRCALLKINVFFLLYKIIILLIRKNHYFLRIVSTKTDSWTDYHIAISFGFKFTTILTYHLTTFLLIFLFLSGLCRVEPRHPTGYNCSPSDK